METEVKKYRQFGTFGIFLVGIWFFSVFVIPTSVSVSVLPTHH